MSQLINGSKIIRWCCKQLLVLGIATAIMGFFLFFNGLYELRAIHHIEMVHSDQVSPQKYSTLWQEAIITLKVLFYTLNFGMSFIFICVGFCVLRIRHRLKKIENDGGQ